MSDYEPCGICGYDHEYDYAMPGVADLILQAHLPALFDSVHVREPVDVMPPPDARAFAIMRQLFGPADKNGIIHIPRR